jgi:hypothetical protein
MWREKFWTRLWLGDRQFEWVKEGDLGRRRDVANRQEGSRSSHALVVQHRKVEMKGAWECTKAVTNRGRLAL